MMDTEIRALVQQLHDTPGQLVLATAGAGTTALSWLFGVAGASRTVLEVQIPYSKKAFNQFTGREPEKYVSAVAGRWLAGNALRRAYQLREEVVPVIGVGCTAAIITDRPKKGVHHAVWATWTPQKVTTHYLQLQKEARDRPGEDELISRLLLQAIAAAYELPLTIPIPLLPTEQVQTEIFEIARPVQQLLADETSFVGVYSDGRAKTAGINPQILLPGSFNPLHEGHLELAQVAGTRLNRPVAFELSVTNVDKPPLEEGVVLARLAQFAGRHPVYLTNAPTFLAKAQLFPHTTFVIGRDTAERILSPRYYNHSEQEMTHALETLRNCGGHFLVAGRVRPDGKFDPAETLVIPPSFQDLFTPISEQEFRRDISSTHLRAQGLGLLEG